MATVTALAALPRRNQQDQRTIERREGHEDQMPIADFALPEPTNRKERALRRARGSRYNKREAEPIAELAPGTEVLPLNSHWWWGLRALPASTSDVVVVGDVVDARAYLSGDKTGIYSEFTIRAADVLKNDGSVAFEVGGEIVAERRGGVVRFPSGRLQRYATAQQGMPQVGRRYLLFLASNSSGQDFALVTAYELSDGRVLPIDGYGNNREHVIPSFTVFEGMDEATFLKLVSDAISNPSEDPSEKGKGNQ